MREGCERDVVGGEEELNWIVPKSSEISRVDCEVQERFDACNGLGSNASPRLQQSRSIGQAGHE